MYFKLFINIPFDQTSNVLTYQSMKGATVCPSFSLIVRLKRKLPFILLSFKIVKPCAANGKQ